MDKRVHYVLVAYWEKSGCKIVADYPSNRDSGYRSVTLSTVDGIRTLADDRISLARGKYTVHLLIGELHYACLTSKAESMGEASQLEITAYGLLEKIRNVYRELPILADLSRDLKNLAIIDLSKPLRKVIEDQKQFSIDKLPHFEVELAEIRRALMDGVQKLIDRGEKLDELVRKTQSLQIMTRKDFQLATRLTKKKKNNVLVATAAAVAMFLSTSLLVIFMYIGFV